MYAPTLAKKKKRVKKKVVPKSVQIYKKKKEEKEDSESSSHSEEDYTDDEHEGTSGYKKGGYHPVKIGELYKGRYRVVEKLGWGHFSTVWLCKDEKCTNPKFDYVAMKIVKSASHYTEAALDEIKILSRIAKNDPQNSRCVVHLLDNFEHRGPNGKHVCMIFEVLGSNLLDLIKHYDYKGVPLKIVKSICKQVLIGLDYLHTKCGVIHTDLKPENVLLHIKLPKLIKKSHDSSESEDENDEDNEDDDENIEESGEEEDEINKGEEEEEEEEERDEEVEEEKEEKNSKKEVDENKKRQKSTSPRTNGKQALANDLSNLTIDTKSQDIEMSDQEQSATQSTQEQKSTDSSVADSFIKRQEPNPEDPETYGAKIADFGNACWVDEHFTNDIQTRQYRAPEIILGHKWGPPVDMWSMGCMVFELATGDLLFEPKEGSSFNKNDDHLAQMIELLGRMPKKMATTGKYSRSYFTKNGELKYIRKLQMWSLEDVFVEKYKWEREEAKDISTFILSMLRYYPEQRTSAAESLKHKWLKDIPPYLEGEKPPTTSEEAIKMDTTQ